MRKLLLIFILLPFLVKAESPTPHPFKFNEKDFFMYAPNAVRNWYISGTGSDSNTGTIGSPYRTIDKIDAQSLTSGDSIFYEKSYSYTGSFDKSTSNLYVGSYGTGAKPVMIYVGSAPEKSRNVFRFSGSNNKVVGLNFTYPTQNPDRHIVAYVSIGLLFDGGNHNSALLCDFSLIGVGIFFQDGTGSNAATYCTFNDLRAIVNDVAPDNDYGSNGVLFGGCSNNVVSYCDFDSCFVFSTDYGYDGGALEAYGACSNNVIKYCTMNMCDGVFEIGSGSGGTASKNVFAYNKIVNCGELTYTGASGGFPVQCDRMRYYNNIIIDTVNFKGAASMFNFAGTETADTVFDLRNNIFYAKGGIDIVTTSDASKTFHANNTYCLSGGSTAGYTLGASEHTSTPAAEWVAYGTNNFALNTTAQSYKTGQDYRYIYNFGTDLYGNTITYPCNMGAVDNAVVPPPSNSVKFPVNIGGKIYTKYQ